MNQTAIGIVSTLKSVTVSIPVNMNMSSFELIYCTYNISVDIFYFKTCSLEVPFMISPKIDNGLLPKRKGEQVHLRNLGMLRA